MIKEIVLNDPKEGRLSLLVSFSLDGSTWGDFEPLRGTTWASGISEVKAESLSHAMHGWVNPLQKELGRAPKSSANKVSATEGRCHLAGECLGWDPNLCRPGGQKPHKKEQGPPGCYEAPLGNGIFEKVAQAWKSGTYTIVCIGEEFSLT